MTKNDKIEQILRILEGQKFADWYGSPGDEVNSKFDSYIRVDYPEGHPKHISREMIKQDIEKLFASIL